jgi:hypothetical protein
VRGICVNEEVNHHNTNSHINMGYPILVWDFKQGTQRRNARWYVILVYASRIGDCVLVVRMHQIIHGGKTCDDFQIQ